MDYPDIDDRSHGQGGCEEADTGHNHECLELLGPMSNTTCEIFTLHFDLLLWPTYWKYVDMEEAVLNS